MKGYVRKRGKVYAYTVDIGKDPITGKRKQKSKSGFKTKKEAQSALAELIASVEKGTYVEKRKTKFREFAEEFLYKIYKNKVKPSTFERTETVMKFHVFPFVKEMDIQDINAFLVHDFLEEKRKEDYSSSYIHRINETIKMVLRAAFKQGVIEKDIAASIDNPRIERKEMNVWTIQQVKDFLRQAKHSRYYVVFFLAAYTGMRKGEILGLQWDDVDFDKRTIRVNKTLYKVKNEFVLAEPKTTSSIRHIYMDDDILRALRKHKVQQNLEKMRYGGVYQDHNLVFPKEDGTFLTPSAVNCTFLKYLKRFNLPRIRFHDLRHTHATILLEMGVHPKVVSDRLGHKSIKTTLDIYSHVSTSLQKDLSEQFSKVMKHGESEAE